MSYRPKPAPATTSSAGRNAASELRLTGGHVTFATGRVAFNRDPAAR